MKILYLYKDIDDLATPNNILSWYERQYNMRPFLSYMNYNNNFDYIGLILQCDVIIVKEKEMLTIAHIISVARTDPCKVHWLELDYSSRTGKIKVDIGGRTKL